MQCCTLTIEHSFAEDLDPGAFLCTKRDTLLIIVGSTATFSSDGIFRLDIRNSGADEGLPGVFA